MAIYRYRATDRAGLPISGEVAGTNAEEATGRLLERGWVVLQIETGESTSPPDSPAPDSPAPDSAIAPGTTTRLSAEESDELVQHIGRLAATDFPLSAGFRAAAEESEYRRVAESLRQLAERLDGGQPLASLLTRIEPWLPAHIAGLILAAQRSGRLGESLLEFAEHQRAANTLRRSLWRALAYPLMVAVTSAVLVAFIAFGTSSTFEHMFAEFGLSLPFATRQVFWWRDTGIWLVMIGAAGAVMAAWLYRWRRGAAAWARLVSTIPLLGPVFSARGWAEWLGLMKVLIKNQVPLPDALRWSGDGVSNPWIAQLSNSWAQATAAGQSLAEVLANPNEFPAGVTPLIRWGEKNGTFEQAFATGREILVRRVGSRTALLRTILPPFLFAAIGCSILMLVMGLLIPLFSLLEGLSGGTARTNLDFGFAAQTPLVVMLAGVVLFWIAASRRRLSPPGSFPTVLALRAAGGTLFVGGLMGGVVVTTQGFALIMVPLVGVVLIAAVRRYYEAERQSLVWVLVTAAERGIPLDQAARAFAEERNDIPGARAARLADYLEAGVPPGLALRRSGHRVDAATSLAADLGYQTGTLGPALRQVAERSGEAETVTMPMAARMIYLGLVVLHTLLVQSFVVLSILPKLTQIHHDFELRLPAATRALNQVAEPGTNAWYLLVVVSTIGLLFLLLGFLSFLGFSLRRIPVVRRLWWRIDSSLVMRWLASGVRQQRPILEMLRLLAGYFPQPAMQGSLERSAQRVEQGSHWCDCLQRAGVIRHSDNAVLKAAERVGNLPWALDELADQAVRKWSFHLQVAMSFAFPIVLVALSCGVLAVILGVLLPLVSLVTSLS